MNDPEPITHFISELLSTKAVLKAIRKSYGEEATEWLKEAKDEDPSLLETFILDNQYDIAPEPVKVLKATGAYDDPFEVRIYKIGPIFWVAANEFEDVGYFRSLKDAKSYAEDEYSSFLNPPDDEDSE
jgi:hypothetical protein